MTLSLSLSLSHIYRKWRWQPEAVCISHRANSFAKGMNTIFIPPAMGN